MVMLSAENFGLATPWGGTTSEKHPRTQIEAFAIDGVPDPLKKEELLLWLTVALTVLDTNRTLELNTLSSIIRSTTEAFTVIHSSSGDNHAAEAGEEALFDVREATTTKFVSNATVIGVTSFPSGSLPMKEDGALMDDRTSEFTTVAPSEREGAESIEELWITLLLILLSYCTSWDNVTEFCLIWSATIELDDAACIESVSNVVDSIAASLFTPDEDDADLFSLSNARSD
jgi:hypothetical protein